MIQMSFRKKLAAVAMTAAMTLTALCFPAHAGEPYTGYNYDFWG